MVKNIFFVGAGGIGMANLERYFLSKGHNVGGYDRTPSELTDALRQEGARIFFDDDPSLIGPQWRDPADTLVVYTPAVPADNRVLSSFREGGFEVIKRAALLGKITHDSDGICVAGSHGKTTVSSMAGLILHRARTGCNAFLGGILRNTGSNLLLSPGSRFSVIEADEYDRSFHHLSPFIAVVTSTDPDHLDIYGTEEAYLESFARFTELIRPGGILLLHTGLKLRPRPDKSVKTYTYSRNEGDFHAANVRIGQGTIVFDFVTPDGIIPDIELGVPVDINIENSIAAMAACLLTGDITPDDLRAPMASFLGAERRFQFLLKRPDRVVIDDYAHHPDELRQSIRSVRALYPDKKLTVAFQPHLYSRTRDFAPQFAEALSLADEVVMTELYPARELPIEGVSSEIIFDRVICDKKTLIRKEDFVNTMKNCNFEVLLALGAGDLSLLLPSLVEQL